MAAVPGADHGARLLAGGAVRAARAPRRARAGRRRRSCSSPDRRSRSGSGPTTTSTTTGLIPTALVTCAMTIGLLRAAYDSLALELRRRAARRRRRPRRRGRGPGRRCSGRSAAARPASRTSSSACVPPERDAASSSSAPSSTRPDEVILARAIRRADGARDRRDGAPRGRAACGSRRRRPSCWCSAASTFPARACRSSSCGRRCSPARTGASSGRSTSSSALLVVVVGLPVWLLIALAIKLDSRGPVLYRDRRSAWASASSGCSSSARWCRAPSELQDELEDAERGGGCALQDSRRPAGDAGRQVLRRLSLDELPQVLNVLARRDEPRRPRPLPAPRLPAARGLAPQALPRASGHHRALADLRPLDLSFDDLVRLDFYYLENWSIWLDISISSRRARGDRAARRLLARAFAATSAGRSRPSRCCRGENFTPRRADLLEEVAVVHVVLRAVNELADGATAREHPSRPPAPRPLLLISLKIEGETRAEPGEQATDLGSAPLKTASSVCTVMSRSSATCERIASTPFASTALK